MGLFILFFFAMTEIALTVLTFTKWPEKASFRRNRLIATAAEFILPVLIMVLPTTYLKWRFAVAVGLVGIRLVIAGIRFFGGKAQGNVKKASRILCCVLVLVLSAMSLLPSFLFANYSGLPLTGEYDFAQCSAILVDRSRIDTFETDGSYREVPVHFFYPDAEGTFPLVIFSHGAFGYYESNFSTYAELASQGYVVAALDHPHHAFFTNDTSGNMVIVDTTFFANAMEFGNSDMSTAEGAFAQTRDWMRLRTGDMNFVVDTIKAACETGKLSDAFFTEEKDAVLSVIEKTDTSKIGLLGHSMGGATAVAVGRQRDDITAVIVLDGSMLSEITDAKTGSVSYENTPYPIPVLDFRKAEDYNMVEAVLHGEQSREKYGYIFDFCYVNNHVIDNAVDGRTVVFDNAGHMDFTDLPMFSPFLGGLLGSGDVDNEAFMATVNSLVLNWFDYYLKGEGTLDIQARY